MMDGRADGPLSDGVSDTLFMGHIVCGAVIIQYPCNGSRSKASKLKTFRIYNRSCSETFSVFVPCSDCRYGGGV